MLVYKHLTCKAKGSQVPSGIFSFFLLIDCLNDSLKHGIGFD